MSNHVIHYQLLLPARNYLYQSNYCRYTEYSHISTIDPLADLNMSTWNVKSATIDWFEYEN